MTDRYHASILVAPAIVESSSRCAKLLDENRTEGQAIDGLDRVRPGIVGLADSGHCSPSAQLGPIQLGLTHLIRLGSCTPSGRIHGQQSIYISCARASCSLRLERGVGGGLDSGMRSGVQQQQQHRRKEISREGAR